MQKRAFMCKLSWKYLTQPNNFWVKIMHAKYPMTSDFFTYHYKSKDSYIWKCLLQTRELFGKGVSWKLGNRHSIEFQQDNRCERNSILEMLQLGQHDASNIDAKVNDFITSSKEWNLSLLSYFLTNDICMIIKSITP